MNKVLIIYIIISSFITGTVMASKANISGKSIYLDRMVLPQNAIFKATLEDISLMDVPSVVLGSVIISPAGQIPITFEIPYNTNDIKKGHCYSILGKITVNDKLLYITDTLNLVLNGKDNNLQIIMKRVNNSSLQHEPKTMMQGMYMYMADASIFKECHSGEKIPILFEADNIALERAYNKDKKEAGAWLKIQVEGKIIQRPKMEGAGVEDSLLVERFIKTMPNKLCENQQVDASFENTYWKLTSINGESVKTKSSNREAYIIFQSVNEGKKAFKGTSGCNKIFGSYESKGSSLTINHKQIAMTKMACPNIHIEKSFLLTLKETTIWQIKGNNLELLDASYKVLAHFKAIYF